MAPAKRKTPPRQVHLRWVQANIKFTTPAKTFVAGLDLIADHHPDVITLNEVGGRVSEIAGWAARCGYIHIQPKRQHGMVDDQAILLRASRFTVGIHSATKMHEEPPGAPTARYLLWAQVEDHVSGLDMLFEAFHSLAAVERGNKLNPIQRTRYYVAGNVNLLRCTRALRIRIAARAGRSTVPVILAGDLNWSWRPGSWIDKTLGVYFTANHTALGFLPTLGKRAVDIVAKRGGRVRFHRQFTFHLPSDHKALCVDLLLQAI